jgi:hypothetical protein
MSLLNGFDAATVEPSEAFTPLPAGEYTCLIAASEEKPTASGSGEYLKLTIEVLDGEHKGRHLFENLNLKNPSEVAVKIAQQTLSAICRAVGVMRPQHAMELHGRPFVATVAVEKRKDNGELSNRIKGYKAIGGNAGTAAQPKTGMPWSK